MSTKILLLFRSMNKDLTIGEVSELLNISCPTLRYWQKENIFPVNQDGMNNYRKYSVADLINIAEISFYRNLGIPIKEMRRFNTLNLNDYEKILNDAYTDFETKINNYKIMLKKIILKNRQIKNIKELKNTEYAYEDIPFNYVVKFDYGDKQKLIQYANNPSLYVRCINSSDINDDERGIITQYPDKTDKILWEKTEKQRYIVFLVEEIVNRNFLNNIPEKLKIIHKRHRTGKILVNYLISESIRNQRIDYLKAYIEIL